MAAMTPAQPLPPEEATVPVPGQAGRHCTRILLAANPASAAPPLADARDGDDLWLFESVTEALEAALALQDSGRQGIAVHRGGCLEGADGVRPLGASAALARALAALAAPAQILVSEPGFEALAQDLPADAPWVSTLEWRAHGRYRVQGEAQDLGIVEVSAGPRPDSQPPADSDRVVRLPDDGLIPGWRAAVGQRVPLRPDWRLLRKLGAGGFGEAWLGRHAGSGEQRVFKFCYHASRLTSLKREVTLFRLLQKGIGGDGFVPVLDWHLDSAPYFLETAYVSGGDLRQWCAARGGVSALPFDQRINIAAQMAEALAAAHAIGVLHKDIKPSNVLVEDAAQGPRVRLCDFGVGAVTETLRAEAAEMTVAGGGSRSALFGGTALIGGTPMYMAPELFEGRPPTIHGDAYALGVVLYQLAVGDFGRALGAGWEDDIEGEPLRSDIASLVARDPAQRRSDLAALAIDLRRLGEREAQRVALMEAESRAARSRRLRRLLLPAFAAVTLLALVLAAMLQRISEEAARANAEAERANLEAASAREVTDFFVGLFRIANPDESRGAAVTVREVLDRGAERVDQELAGQPQVRARLLNVIGNVYRQLGLFRDAVPMIERAVAVETESGAEPINRAGTLNRLAALYGDSGQFERAVEVAEASLAIMEQAGLDTDKHYGDALSILGSVLNDIGDRARAGPVLERTLAWRQQHLDPESGAVAVSLNNLGFHRLQIGDYAGAADLFERALKIRRTTLGEEHSETAISWNNIASVQRLRGHLDQAEEGARRATAIWEGSLGPEHPFTTVGWHNLGSIARLRGELGQARDHLERSLAVRRATLDGDHPWLATGMLELAPTLSALGETERALALAHEALELRLRRGGEDDKDTALARVRLAEILLESGQLEAALDQATRGLAPLRALHEADSEDSGLRQDLAHALFVGGWALAQDGGWSEAERLWHEGLALIDGVQGQDRLARVDQLRARLHALLGDTDQAGLYRQRMESGGQRDALLERLSAARASRP
jgi:serine/threonine protein kinase